MLHICKLSNKLDLNQATRVPHKTQRMYYHSVRVEEVQPSWPVEGVHLYLT